MSSRAPGPELLATLVRRRRDLMRRLGEGLLFVPTAPEHRRNGDVHQPFRPGSDFQYLAGCREPSSAFLLSMIDGELRSALLVQPKDPERETWDGPRHGVKAARKRFGVDEAHSIEDLEKVLGEWLRPHERFFAAPTEVPALDRTLQRVFAGWRAGRRRRNPPAHPDRVDPTPTLGDMRLIKDRLELAAMREAAEISAAGHCAAMRCARAGMFEYEVQAELEAEFRRGGSRRNGYESIVASGAGACILHYIENDRKMRRGDLLLIDAGAEIDGYTADITRTFPVSGKFSEAQAAVYDVVLKAEETAIRAVRPGATLQAVHAAAVRSLCRGLVRLGVLSGKPAEVYKAGVWRRYYMHGTSHWLGRDVHDVGAYEDVDGKPVPFRAGMVLTVEPGLYFGPRDETVPKELRGIGIRIEDDVAVTRSGHDVLSSGVPKSRREVEAMCAR